MVFTEPCASFCSSTTASSIVVAWTHPIEVCLLSELLIGDLGEGELTVFTYDVCYPLKRKPPILTAGLGALLVPFTITALHRLSFTAAIYALVIRAVVFAKPSQPTIVRLARVLFAVTTPRRPLAFDAALLSTCVVAAVGSPLTFGFAVGCLAVVCATEG